MSLLDAIMSEVYVFKCIHVNEFTISVVYFTQTEIFCSESPAPQNGTMSIATASNENRYSLGSVARYSCNTGFALVGQTTRVCEDTNGGIVTTGTWSGSLPTCEGTAELSQFISEP